MVLSDGMYVPALRWRQGEYQALWRLANAVKDKVVPLITVPEVEFDFELRQPKRTVHEHALPFPERFRTKWGTRPAWVHLDERIAIDRMDDGAHVFDYIFDALRPHQTSAIPSVPLGTDTDTLAAARRAVSHDGRGIAVTLRLEDLMAGNPKRSVVGLLETVSSDPGDADLIIDLRDPNFEPYDAFARALVAALRKMGDLNRFRNLVLLSTAIPDTFAGIARGTDRIPRHDWLFHRALLAALPGDMRKPTYGDYTVVHPDFVAKDMRKIRAAGKVIYTTTDAWATRKGGAFRGDEAQMHRHCEEIVKDSTFQFKGAAFSYGDGYIAGCASGRERPSNQTRWKVVAINHHITMVVNDLATTSAAPWPP